MSDSSPRKKDDNDNDGGEKNTCAANKRQNCSPEKGTPPQTDSSARRSDDPGERIQAHHVSQSIVQAKGGNFVNDIKSPGGWYDISEYILPTYQLHILHNK